MNTIQTSTLSKVPAVTLGFWIIKVFATLVALHIGARAFDRWL